MLDICGSLLHVFSIEVMGTKSTVFVLCKIYSKVYLKWIRGLKRGISVLKRLMLEDTRLIWLIWIRLKSGQFYLYGLVSQITICFKGLHNLYSIRPPLSSDPRLESRKTPQRNPLTGKNWKKPSGGATEDQDGQTGSRCHVYRIDQQQNHSIQIMMTEMQKSLMWSYLIILSPVTHSHHSLLMFSKTCFAVRTDTSLLL